MSLLIVMALAAAAPELRIEVAGGSQESAEALRIACNDVAATLGPPPSPWRLELRQAKSVDEFAERTGRARFEGAALVGPMIWLQPQAVLAKFDAPAIFRHECVHAWLRAQKIPPLPRVVEESLAAWVSLQAAKFPPAQKLDAAELAAAEKTLSAPRNDAELSKVLHRAAATMVPIFSRWTAEKRLLQELRIVAATPAWDRTLWQQFMDRHR